jgi:hypothetical protein
MKVAKLDTGGRRLVIDYDLLSSSGDVTLDGDTTYLVSSPVNITSVLTIEGGTVVKFNYTNGISVSGYASNIVCLTRRYSPAVFTSMNDNSVGQVISGSTGTPTVSDTYIIFTLQSTQAMTLRYLRFCYAATAISGTINNGGVNTDWIRLWDCQFFDCTTAFNGDVQCQSIMLYLYNVLFSEVNYGVTSLGSTGTLFLTAENVTADNMESFASATGSSSNSAVNCLFTAVSSLPSIPYNNCISNSSSAGFYQTVGAGSYYLAAGSTNRNAGMTNINPTLLADLQTLTTYPPVVMTGAWLTSNTNLSPQAQRDTNGLNLGYHYCPVDYAINIAVSNATVTVLPGTALAMYGEEYGVWLYADGIFNCNGTATSPNYIVSYNTVQEQSNTNWETTAWIASIITPGQADSSSANFTFTDWSVLTGGGQISGQSFGCPVALQNCQFYGGEIDATAGPVLSATNCLFRRVETSVTDAELGNTSQPFYNNLFLDGSLTVRHSGAGIWTFRDNLFDTVSITNKNGAIINVCSNNAYVTTNNGVLSPENNDQILTASPAYQVGVLGQNYYPTTSSLIHAGSQSAVAAGLAFYTVTSNNVIDGTNMVSIGFHYLDVGVGAGGLPVANNGLPDSWQLEYLGQIGINSNADFDSSGLSILQDYQEGIDPNIIAFNLAVTNQSVNTSGVPLQITVTAGIPFYMAELVDNTNLADANWIPYNLSPNVSVGTNSGWHQIWFGLRGLPTTGQQTWAWCEVNLDKTPPVLIITNPLPGVVTAPIIQIQGYSLEDIAVLTYNLSNSSGTWTNQQALVTTAQFDTNTWTDTTNGITCFDIPLVDGTNTVTLHATDLAGNVTSTNLIYVYNPAANTNPPIVTLSWPQNATVIASDDFTLRGVINDPFATVNAQIVNNGSTIDVTGLVEQNGSFWIENLPLGTGTNYLTVTATNAAGYGIVTNIAVTQSTVNLSDIEVTFSGPVGPTADVEGAITGDGIVVVNGVASTESDGYWGVGNVLVPGFDTAVVSLDVTTDGTVRPGDPQTEVDVVAGPGLFYAGYNANVTYTDDGTSIYSNLWTYGLPGSDTQIGCGSGGYIISQTTWPGNGVGTNRIGTNAICGGTPAWCCAASYNLVDYYLTTAEHSDLLGSYDGETERRKIQSSYWLTTGGQSDFSESLWILHVTAESSGFDVPPGNWQPQPIPPSTLSVAGQRLGTNGNAYIVMAKGVVANATPIGGPSGYTFSIAGTNYAISSQTQCVAPGNSDSSRTTIGIGEQVNLSITPSTTLPVTWSVAGGGSLSNTDGISPIFTASMSPSTSIISARIGPAPPCLLMFTVIAPTGVTGQVLSNSSMGTLGPPNRNMGASTTFAETFMPSNVSFLRMVIGEVVPNYTISWPNGTQTSPGIQSTSIITNVNGCSGQWNDTVADGLYSTNLLFNGTSYQNFSFTVPYTLWYMNQAEDLVFFAANTTVTSFTATTFQCSETWRGISGPPQGPWR